MGSCSVCYAPTDDVCVDCAIDAEPQSVCIATRCRDTHEERMCSRETAIVVRLRALPNFHNILQGIDGMPEEDQLQVVVAGLDAFLDSHEKMHRKSVARRLLFEGTVHVAFSREKRFLGADATSEPIELSLATVRFDACLIAGRRGGESCCPFCGGADPSGIVEILVEGTDPLVTLTVASCGRCQAIHDQ